MDQDKVTALILQLLSLPGIGSASVLELLRELDFKDRDTFSFGDLKATHVARVRKGLEDGTITESSFALGAETAKRVMDACDHQSIRMVTVFDPAYPDNLKVLKNHPVLLYVRGNAAILQAEKSAAIIGTREPAPFAESWAESAGRWLCDCGYVIVGGLAKGCDTAGHRAAVRSGRPTIAILGQGLGTAPYPEENATLAEEILQTGGALVSEYVPWEKVSGRHLVERDAWQAGISDGVISIESMKNGGTLHAMNSALKYGRPLGILDHTAAAEALHDPDLAGLPQAEGLERIVGKAADRVYRLYSEESLQAFATAMEKARRKRLQAEDGQMSLTDL